MEVIKIINPELNFGFEIEVNHIKTFINNIQEIKLLLPLDLMFKLKIICLKLKNLKQNLSKDSWDISINQILKKKEFNFKITKIEKDFTILLLSKENNIELLNILFLFVNEYCIESLYNLVGFTLCELLKKDKNKENEILNKFFGEQEISEEDSKKIEDFLFFL